MLASVATPAFCSKHHATRTSVQKKANTKLSTAFLAGTWVPKGGNPSMGAYTFNKDKTYSYIFDDSGWSGKFSYKNGTITFKMDTVYLSGEARKADKNEKKPQELKIAKKDSYTIVMGGRTYKNIKYLKNANSEWYGYDQDAFANNPK